MPASLKDLRKAPWTLWAQVLFSFVSSLAYDVIYGIPKIWFLPVGWLLGAVLAFFLLRGTKWIWWLFVVGSPVAILEDVLGPHPVWGVSVTIVSLVLLLAPQSRRYVFPPKPKTMPRELSSTWDPNQHEDSARLSGWYFDPGDPARMRCWDAKAGSWLGVTKTPRKLRRAREAESG